MFHPHYNQTFYSLFFCGGGFLINWEQNLNLEHNKNAVANLNAFENRTLAQEFLRCILTDFEDFQRQFYGMPQQLHLFCDIQTLPIVYNDFTYTPLPGHFNPAYLDQFYVIVIVHGKFTVEKNHFNGKGNHVIMHRQGNCFDTYEHAGEVLQKVEERLYEFALAYAELNQLELFAA